MNHNAAGRILVGFSHPTVGLYSAAGGTVSHASGRRLARGVDVSLSVDTSDDNNFYADNQIAESDSGKFTKGKTALTVDGLHDDAERMVYGIPEPTDVACGDAKKVKITKYGDSAKVPYVGIGFLLHYLCHGIDMWQPMILPKCKFLPHGTEGKTQEESLNWQTQKLEATIFRDDSIDHDWKWLVEEQTTEAEALAVLDGLLGVAAAAVEG